MIIDNWNFFESTNEYFNNTDRIREKNPNIDGIFFLVASKYVNKDLEIYKDWKNNRFVLFINDIFWKDSNIFSELLSYADDTL